MPGFPVLHCYPRVCLNSFPLTRWCYLTISSSANLFSFCLNLSQNQGLFQWVRSAHHVGKHWSFSFSISHSNEYSVWFFLGLTRLISLLSRTLKSLYSTTLRKHRFFSTQPYVRSNLHIHTWLLEKPQLWLYQLLLTKWCLCILIYYLDWSQLSSQGASVF